MSIAHPNSNTYRHGHTDNYWYTDCDGNRHRYPHIDADGNINGDADYDNYAESDSHTYAYAQTDADAKDCANSAAASYSRTSPVAYAIEVNRPYLARD